MNGVWKMHCIEILCLESRHFTPQASFTQSFFCHTQQWDTGISFSVQYPARGCFDMRIKRDWDWTQMEVVGSTSAWMGKEGGWAGGSGSWAALMAGKQFYGALLYGIFLEYRATIRFTNQAECASPCVCVCLCTHVVSELHSSHWSR